MAGSLNKILLIGNLGKDPEVFHFEGGGIKVRFPLATSESYQNRAGDRVTHTEWHNVVVQRKGLAEVCEKYLKKGHKVFIEGRIRSRNWTDDQGQTKYVTEINVDNMTMLTSREEAMQHTERNQNSGYTPPPPASSTAANESINDFNSEIRAAGEDDDLPF